MEFEIKTKCKKCGNQTFRIEKTTRDYETEQKCLITETMCHDGFGWDLNSFKIICDKCESIDEDEFMMKENKK